MSLTRTQSKRLATILAIISKENLPIHLELDATGSGWAEKSGDYLKLTDKGLDEKNRLCALAGLSIKYSFENKTPPEGGDKTEVL